MELRTSTMAGSHLNFPAPWNSAWFHPKMLLCIGLLTSKFRVSMGQTSRTCYSSLFRQQVFVSPSPCNSVYSFTCVFHQKMLYRTVFLLAGTTWLGTSSLLRRIWQPMFSMSWLHLIFWNRKARLWDQDFIQASLPFWDARILLPTISFWIFFSIGIKKVKNMGHLRP